MVREHREGQSAQRVENPVRSEHLPGEVSINEGFSCQRRERKKKNLNIFERWKLNSYIIFSSSSETEYEGQIHLDKKPLSERKP